MARLAPLAAGIVGLVVLAVLLAIPFFTKDRQLSGTFPQPAPLVSTALVVLRGGDRVCLDEAVMDPHGTQAHIRVGTFRKPPMPLRFDIEGAGYRVSRRVAATYRDNDLLTIDVPPPVRATEVRVCVANAGARRIALYGSQDRTHTRSRTTLRGKHKPLVPNFDLWFTEREPASLAERAGTIVHRITMFRPDVVGPWLVWALLVVVLVGVPVGVVAALERAVREDEGQR